MVRETRHLWIGNLPENVREEQIRDLFQRHGRVQSVKLLSEDTSASAGGSMSGGNGGVRSGKSATVAFIDIRSAAKAFRAVHSMAGQPLDINYHEPGSAPPRCHPPIDSHPSTEAPSDIPVVIGQGSTSNNVGSNQSPGMHNNSIPGPSAYRQQRFPPQHGQSEDSSSHFYDQPKGFSRGRGDGHGYRGRRDRHNNYNRHSFHNNNMDRGYRMSWNYSNESGRVAPPAHSQVDERTTGPAQSTHPPVTSEVTKPPRRPDSPASTVSSRHVPSKRHKSRSVSESGSSDRGSTAGSRSRSGSRSSVSTSVSSGRSRSPPHHGSSNHFSRGGSGTVRFHQNSYSRQRYRRSRVTNRPTDSRARHSSRSPVAASPSSSTSSSPSPHRKAATTAPHSPSHSPSSSKSYSPSRGGSTTSHHHHQHHRRPPNTAELHAAIKIRNLPIRSSDTSLKDGLYHAYKKHGKVAWVRVIGSAADRYAIVCFKSQEYAAKAVQSSQDKQFFGCKIQVTPYYTGKGEESVGGTDEESRGPGEEESSFPTRTVLITSLDSSVTVSELKSAFDQYGDIVNIDIRKQGSSTHAVCEFLDIASAIRAKWGRHVFKSREARISFFRNPPTNALLLDGTAGVTEKQVTSHCCQYGAIKRVDMDPERFLALVQYEEISSAETAIRELGNWAIKGKKLDIDFASQEVIRRFQERLDPGLSNSSLSICGSSSPSSNPIAALNAGVFKDGTSRKVRSRLGEYLGDEDGVKSGYYRNEMDNDSKPMTTAKLLEESSPPSTLNASRISALSGREPHETLNSTVDHLGYKRLEHSTDSQRNAAVCTKSGGKERTEKFSSSGSIKIDLSCHETDSAIVTSSSDIIAVENSDTDVHSNFTGSSASGDEKVGSFEPATKHRKSSSENVSSVLTTTTVDGVSSTSPEPKSEIVSTSADPGVGIGTDSVARYLNDAVATDSQKRVVDCKVRRTSADSGNNLNSSPECNVLHSNQDNETILSSKPIKKSELVRPPAALTSNSQGTEDSDDRPGTPLCDENPEGFEAPVLSPSVKSDSAAPPTRSKPDPTNPTEVPKVAVKQSSTTPVKDPKSSSSNSSSSCSGNTAKKVVSPTISPSSGASSSVMLSSTNDTSIFSPFNESSEIPAYSRTSTNVFENSSTPSQFCVAKKELKIDDVSCGAVSSEVNTEQVTSVQEVKDKPDIVENDESASGTGFSSDSEGGLSPRHSPTTDSLEQRVKNICEKFDTWDGNRKILNHKPVSHSHLLSNSSSQDVNESIGNKPDSLIDKIKQTIPHFTGPSDIGRTVLAKKTIFDEDCERLVNYSEKYEIKPSTLLTATTNWKLPTLSRSTSCSSTSSAPFLGQTSPLAVSSNCMPPLSSPVCISPVSGSFNGTASSKPHTPVCSSPNYSPSLSSTIVGKNAPEKVKDLNANVTPQLNRSSGHIVQKSFSTPSSSKPSTSLGVPISGSGCTKLSSSPPSLPMVKAPTDTLTTTPIVVEATKQELGSAVAKKVSNVQPLIHTPMTSTHSAQALNMVTTTAASPSPVVQNSGLRAMERSLSLESRKNSPAVPSGFQSSFPCNGPSAHLPETPTSADSARSLTPRRISVETLNSANSSSSLDSKQNLQIPSEKSSNAIPGTSETSRDKPSSVSGSDAHAHAHHSFREKMQPKEAAVPSSKSVNPMNTLISKKNEMTSLKDEISAKVQPVHQETTVAVVATVQTPLLTSRNEVISTSSSKESSKKDKDKKRRSSGGSTPVSSGGGGHQSGSSSMKSDSHSNQGGSTSSSRSSGKDKEERSSRKEKDSKGDTSTKPADSCKNEDSQAHHSSSSSHHKKEKRDKEKDHRENSGDRSSFTTSISKDSHSHKRDRDSKDSSKTKRRLSSQENDQERKKAKVEKDSEQGGHHHHRSKGSETKDARESAKDSSITKDKVSSKDRSEKESSSKSEKSSSSGPTKESSSNAESKREKSDGKERDHHHKSKSSSSSSSSKHHSSSSSSHHQVQKSRSSTDGHSSSSTHKQDSSGMKDSYKKDKEKEKEKDKFSGKENSASKSLSKHHSSHVGHSGSSSSKSKETSSKSNKSSRKDREREKPKQERHPSSLDSDGEENDVQTPSLNLLEHSSERRSESKSERSEKRDSEGKRDRHKSGGGDSLSGMGDSDKSKSRKKEPKKRRRLVVEESGSSDSDGPGVNLLDDEEEEKKHHSIFDVVIDYSDYYVSMYDKVKRSNRACKNITAQQKQQEEEKRKQDKVSESFKQLKQSRAKREEKKRSTSIEERKSMTNSSSDEGSHIDTMNDFDLEHRRSHHDRQSEKAQSSDDEERAKSSMSSSTKSKSKRKMKNKSSRKDEEKSRKRAKRSNKSPSRPNIYSSSTLFSHSDDDSQGSSTHPPDQKKKKLSSGSSRHPISSLASSNNLSFSGSIKSSDESHSETENSERKKMSTSMSSSKPSKSYVSFSDQLSNHQPKYNAHNIYSDSDSSDADQQGVQHKLQPTLSVPHKSKLKEKSSKLKSRKQPLFDSTDSSENEEPVAQPVNKEKKVKDKEREPGKSNKSRDRDKENKIKKRHRSHKSSSMKSRNKYYIPGEASGDGGSHITEKRESGATMEELFGPMTSSSDSDDIRESDHERPKTPTVVMTTPSSCDDSVVSKKSKSSRHHVEKSVFSLPTRHQEPHSLDAEESEISSAHPVLQQSTPPITKSPEKKKKKHHKDKRSKRSSGHEGTPLSSQSSFIKQESSKSKSESVDYDALFNSPAASPVPELKIDSDYVPSDKAPSISPSLPKKESVIVLPVPDIAIRAPTPQPIIPIIKQDPEIDECEKQMRGMFSSDDDEDDEKLKITDAITDAIRASADEQDIDPIREIKEEVDPEWKIKEEEEKKLSCLVEQDKAIESIVLLERKSPTPQSTTTEDEVVKDDILPKDNATISQEETDVAVATILETLGVEEEADEGTDMPPPVSEAKPLIVAPTLPVPAHSPPTLRIVEDAPKPAETSEANDEIASAIAAIPPPDNVDDTKEDDREEPDPWTYDDNRSPKELQIDEGDVEEVNEEEPIQTKPVCLNIPTTQEKVHPAAFEEVSVDSAETKNKVEAKLDNPEARIKVSLPAYNHDGSSKAGDVYEFHDSDDDKRSEKSHITHTRQTPPMISPPAKSPVVQAPAVVSETKIPSPSVSLPMPILPPQQTQEPEKSQTTLVVSQPSVVMSKPSPAVSKPPPVASKPPPVVSKSPPATAKQPSVAPQPPLVATQPPLVTTQPPLVATQPPLSVTQPPQVVTQPSLAVTQASLAVTQPSIVPPLPVAQPPLTATQPPLAVTQPPPLTATQPSLTVSQPPSAIVPPPPVITQPPVAAQKPPPVVSQPPLAATKPPVVAVQSPVAAAKPPLVAVQSPLATVKPPLLAVPPPLPVSQPPPPPVVSISKPTPVTPVQVPPPPPIPVTTPTSVPTSVLAGLPPPPPIVTTVSSAVASVVSSVVSSMVSSMEPSLHTVNVSVAPSTSPLAPSVTSAPSNKGTPPPPPVVTRSTIDEAIDEVIRKLHSGDLPFADSPTMPAPVSAQPAQRAGRRSRSRSKDSPDENASVTRMISRAEPQRHGSNQVLGVIGGHQVETQVPKVGKFGNSELDPNKTTKDNKLETLIDPQTGILTPMLHSDEGQYVPIMGQSNDPQGRLVQSGLHQMPQMHMPNRQTPVISRIMERDPATTRASILEKHATPLLPHQQIPMTKHEGLTAMLAQQQRKSNEPPTTFAFQSQGSPIRAHMALPNAPMQPSVSQPPPLSSVGGTILRAVSVSYAMPLHHSKVTTVVSSIGNPSPTGIPNNNNQGLPQPQSSFQPGHPPVSRGVFVATGVPSGVFQHQQPQILQLTTNKPPERQSPRPNSRHTPGPAQTPPSQGGKPELVHLPELPMQTTVTKINAGEEQQRKSAIMQSMPNVVLTSSPGSIPTGPPYLIRTVVSSPNSQIPMTQQQLQQHRTLQEAFLRSAEGGIRLTTGKDELNEHGPRPNEIIGMASAQREMHGGSLHPSAHSPKPGRVPMPHEQLPTAHINQQRGIPHRPAYETPGTDMRLMPGHGRLTSEGPHYCQTEHPPSFSPHYIPASIPNHIIGHQPPTFTMRHDKPGMPLDGKIQPMAVNDPKGPAMITVVERPPSHNVPPHLSSPHGNEQRNADSPSIGAVFPGQRQIYQTSGLPQQQHPTSQAISNMYAELDGRSFAHSPSYMQYDSRAISVAAAAAAAMEQERERPKGTSSPMDVPYRLRSPPSSLNSGEAGLQGDSLLLLLQRYPIMWQGLLALKNDSAAVQMHFVSGSMNVARDSLPSHPDGSIPPLRISQRMRLEPNQLDGVARKLQINAEHCMLLALPCGRDHMDVLHQSNNLRQGFITYLQLKQAAGIVNICHPDTQQAAYVIHIFPSCDFANENLAKIAPDLLSGVADIAHLLIVIATV